MVHIPTGSRHTSELYLVQFNSPVYVLPSRTSSKVGFLVTEFIFFFLSGAKDPSSVDQSKTLGDLGLDSLLTVELVLLLENDYHVVLSPKELREITINKLKRMEAESANRCDKKDGGEKSEEQSVGSTALVKDGDFLPMDVVLKMNNIEEGIPLFIVHDLFGKNAYI